ncbi:leucine-rich repeat domain-containing protein [Pseudoalteromonas viridis]|uniref:Uncharacterized protein n=1 Tax=Pseudoalteromonas viridis TaxID=339617 RepID=A0ABX7VA32_9GAMM|nr:hypothetical protein [Pseudoalteromonas viridis]QTL36631.1 hypothetical protein J5X90_06255 [Pseudoalteromonas viridis]
MRKKSRCVYAADKGCQQADKQDWFFQPTLFEITAQGEGNGQLFPGYQQIIEGRGAEIYIEPNQGYLLDTITGCGGQLDGGLYLLPKVVQSCEVTATFKQDPSVAARAGITDPVLAQCVNNTHAEMPEQVTELYCDYQDGIQSLVGLTNLTELHTLALSQLEVTALDLSGLEKLTSLHINDSHNGLTSLTMTNPEQLTQLSLINNGLGSTQLAALELERFTALTSLDLSNNQLTELSGAAWPELRFLEVNGNQLATLSIDKNLKLQWLRASGNQLKRLDISANTDLEFVSVSNNQLTGITTAEHPVLTRFLAWSNRLSELQLEGMPKLKDLEVEHNPLVRLDTSHNPELTILWIHGALIRQLDLSANPNLERLFANDLVHLNGLDLSANPRLHYLEIGHNNHWQSLTLADEVVLQYLGMASNPELLSKLSSATARQVSGLNISSTDPQLVDLTPFDKLTALTWQNAGLQQLDLSALPQLSSLNLSENPFSQLDLSPQTQLQQLDLSGTALPGLDISALPDLHTLNIDGSAITVLDVGHNPKLHAIYASHSAIEVVSGLESLENKWANIGLMHNPLSDDTIAYLADLRDHQGYINLSFSKLFVPVIELSGPGSVRLELYYNGNEYYHQAYFEPEPGYAVSEANGCPGHWEGNSYAIEPLTAACTLQVTFAEVVPLSQQIGLTDPALSLCVDNSGYSWPREVVELSCHQAISTTDFAPLAAFHNLTSLQLYQVQASELDFSALPGLTSLSLGGSKVTALAVHPDAPITTLNLEYMSLTNSELAALNLARFTHLEALSLYGNELTEFNGDTLPKLKRLELGWNLLTTLNLTQNPALQHLSTENNPLQVLDISSNPRLIGVRAVFNQLSRIEFGDHPELELLALWNNQLTTLMLNNMPKLRQLYASSNRLTQLDVSAVPSLETLEISDNTLTSLDLAGNVNLQWLVANRMEQLESLDLSHNTQLRSLSLENYDMWRAIRLPDLSNLTFLNVSGSPELFKEITNQPLPALEGLHVNRLSHQIVDLANFPNIISLSWTDAKLPAAYLSEAAALRVVDLSRNPLTELELSRNYQLTELKLNNTQLTALALSHVQALESLEFSHTPVTSLDLQYHPHLYNVYASAAALTEVSGIESVESKFVNLELRNNPLSDDTVAYLTRMREQGYIELRYSQASVAEVKVTGNGVVDRTYLELTEGQTFDLQLSPDQGYQIGTVTGCPGELQGTIYRLGPLQGYCVLEVEFVPLP